jgi:hypothetical protein
LSLAAETPTASLVGETHIHQFLIDSLGIARLILAGSKTPPERFANEIYPTQTFPTILRAKPKAVFGQFKTIFAQDNNSFPLCQSPCRPAHVMAAIFLAAFFSPFLLAERTSAICEIAERG